MNTKMFVFGKQYAGGVSEVYQNDFHKHPAYSIFLSKVDDVTIIDKSGMQYTAPIVLIKPMVEHTVVASSKTICFMFIAPQSAFAKSLDELVSGAGIVKVPPNALPFHRKMRSREIFEVMGQVMEELNVDIDPRLATVLENLESAPLQVSVADITKRCEISPSRLRVLAKKQIGVSLSTLFLWRKLVKAMQTLSSGSTLSQAAQAGGFSDQAHFTRTMHRMFGITPSNSTQPLGCQK